MDVERLDQLVLAALLHDVGKFFERGEVFSEARQDSACLGYCPRDKKGGFHTHLHCALTSHFCDYLEERFDCLRSLPNRDWKIWSAAHHLDDEQSLESRIVRLADRLSSSEREEGQYYQRGISQRTLLEPVLEKVFLQDNHNKLATSYRYPLSRLKADEDSLFPILWKNFEVELEYSQDAHKGISDPRKWKHLLSKDSLKEKYEKLCRSFLNDVEALSAKSPGISVRDLTVCLHSILERYTSNVPSATNVRHPDISLYDHMRTTAAIAQALYIQQKNTQVSPLKNMDVADDPKWILACGDFSGIQKFIYNLTNKGAAKGLRGRSFYVQLFCQISCRYIMRSLNLNPAALLYDSGGKFYLLLPSCLKEDLFAARAEINGWLLKAFAGSVYLGLGIAPVTADMFSLGNMDEAWKMAADDLEKDRCRKFREYMHDPQFFEPQTDFDPVSSCPICGSREVDKSVKCRLCEDLENLGLLLRDTKAVLTAWNKETVESCKSLFYIQNSLDFDALGAEVFFIKGRDLNKLSKVQGIGLECTLINEESEQDLKDMPLPKNGMALQFSYFGKWDLHNKTEKDKPLDFADYAKASRGIKRLGILRMDVDNLGLVFIHGLNFPAREVIVMEKRNFPGWGEVVYRGEEPLRRPMASISRMTTLSRQLKNFFSGFLVHLLRKEENDKCQIIYSGGDDLFIIGSWDQLPDLAETIHKKFKAFCCHNLDLSISGGITLHREKYPIYKASQIAGEAEKKAKTIRSKWFNNRELSKAGICFQGTAIVWEDWALARSIAVMLENETAAEGSKGLASYLRQVIAGNNVLVKRLVTDKRISESSAWLEIVCYPWHWRTKYQLKRRYGDKNDEIEKWSRVLFDQGRVGELNPDKQTGAMLPVFAWLELPLTLADYLQR